MFSLLITLVSVALVAALAIATIFYGGSSLTQSKTKAAAAAMSQQAQQILGAAQVFRATQNRWPDSIDELVSAQYLKDVPQPVVADATDYALISVANAVAQVGPLAVWSTVQPGAPYYWVHTAVPTEVCKAVNVAARGDNGIYNAAIPALQAQCFGQSSNYTVIIGFGDMPGTPMSAVVPAGDPVLLVDSTGGGWSVPPNASQSVVAPTAVASFQDTVGSAVASLAFPSTVVGSNSALQSVVVKNTGSAPLIFSATPATTVAPFSLDASSTCTGTLAVAASCKFYLKFSPTSTQAYSGSSYALTVNSNIAGLTLPLTGTGTGSPTTSVKIVTGSFSSSVFFQKGDGSWSATGSNQGGQLGLGDTTNRLTAVNVPDLNGAIQVVTNSATTYAQFADGTWAAAGSGYWGQLGTGTTANATRFVPEPALNGATQVVIGERTVVAQLANGTWVGTGFNQTGNLGLGDGVNRTTFTPIPALATAVNVSLGSYSTFAQMSDGTWWATGYNSSGELGLGDYVARNTFTKVPYLATATKVVMGQSSTYARLADGAWASVGDNGQGQLGIWSGSQMTNTFTVFSLAPGYTKLLTSATGTVYAQQQNGTWVAAGANQYGQLLNGTTNSISYFQAFNSNGYSNITIGYGFIYGHQASPSYWVGVGRNSSGELGNGTTTSMGSQTSWGSGNGVTP